MSQPKQPTARRLALHKETVRTLTAPELRRVGGGGYQNSHVSCDGCSTVADTGCYSFGGTCRV